ncbi:SCO1860 family LAETG-anchored protein [Streptomyces sp. 6N223]|uniref:SCO1860 family LAETG-anchored protein n=1 Tax=Streptomyces sp. 6N223 TaxID=3457412 RepID=UPI003FD260E8
MFNSAYRPACSRTAALLAAAALLGAAAPAQAAVGDRGEEGAASAAVLRAGLTVSLIDGAVEQPLDVTLNDVAAPSPRGRAEETLLTARLDGVEGGRPVEMLRADVSSAEATTDARGSRAEVALARATVHLPGLRALSLIELETVTASAVCDAGAAPAAASNLGGRVRVLGEDVTLRADGTTTVEAPGVGEVTLALSAKETTGATAAATALELTVAVDPLDLGVAAVDGTVTLAEAACERPGGGGDSASGGESGGASGSGGESGGEASSGDAGPSTQTLPNEDSDAGDPAGAGADDGGEGTDPDLAATGGGSATPFLVGGAMALLAAGGATLFYVRRRASGTVEG